MAKTNRDEWVYRLREQVYMSSKRAHERVIRIYTHTYMRPRSVCVFLPQGFISIGTKE